MSAETATVADQEYLETIFWLYEAGLPIVPVSVDGTRFVMRKGRLMTCPGHVRLIVHEPIAPSTNATPSVDDAKALADRVHRIVADTVDTLQNCRIERLQDVKASATLPCS